MTPETIFIGITFLLGSIAADWTNLTKVRLQILYDLPGNLPLPPLGPVDRMLRRGKEGLSGWFMVPLLFPPMIGIVFFPWYYLFLLPLMFFGGYIAAGLILPEPFTHFYARRTISAVIKFVVDPPTSETLSSQIERISGLWSSKTGKRRLDLVWKGALTSAERETASLLDVYLVWYDDRFERFSETPSSFLHAVCLTKEGAEHCVSRRPLNDGENWDGYEMSGPSNLLYDYAHGFVSLEQLRQLLRGESPTGPKYD